MLMNYSASEIKLSNPLPTSYGIVTGAKNGFVKISYGDFCGYGEAVPISRYGEDIKNVLSCFEKFSNYLGNDPWAIEEVAQIFNKFELKSAAAKSAVNMALYDLVGKLLGIPLYKLLGLSNLDTPYTSYTIGVDTPETVVKKVLSAQNYPIIKLKIGRKNDIDAIKAIRNISDVTIRVDANGGWTPEQAIEMINTLANYNIQFVEQPVASHDLTGLKLVRENVSIPIIADESCLSIQDIPRLSECVDGVNIKLAKCGGISEAIKMIHMAKAFGLKVMIGCFLESSLATTAAAHLTPLADYADLDPILFINHDPYQGVRIENGKIILPETHGLGVELRSDV
ncbi:dipeptide epimerase [Clostridium botulinum]|uniref:mandelate racemase/muconate lactonizing enzyme family protein n=1 Tax=Clostridium botulinum TaxID=1491 RepID=UPI000EBA4B15|nr:dipeptide epimerase [Clostridium botulinum]MBD5643418.1 dipeptide epimerase [Clostridium botulinum]RHW65157.1 dipeptide epimerase [Clostridium botulinum]